MMTPRQRLLAALRGEETDRVAWSPNLAYLWESLPREIQDSGAFNFLQEIGADPLLRGYTAPFRLTHPGCVAREWEENGCRHTEIHTPGGVLRMKRVYSPEGNTWFVAEHPLRTERDFLLFREYLEHIRLEPDYEPVAAAIAQYGDSALVVPLVGLFMKTGFQSLLEDWVGVQELAYALADFPGTIHGVLEILRELDRRTVEIAARSPGEAFIFWEDSSTTNTSPAWFRRYTAPVIDEWGRILHRAGKLLLHHACGHMRALLPIEAELAVDAVESLTPPPTGDVEIWEARAILGERIGIIGGIEPTFFLSSTPDQLRAYVENLLRLTPRRGFILANSDSCPPGVALEKFRLVSEIVREGM